MHTHRLLRTTAALVTGAGITAAFQVTASAYWTVCVSSDTSCDGECSSVTPAR
jgi:hypothetical protein